MFAFVITFNKWRSKFFCWKEVVRKTWLLWICLSLGSICLLKLMAFLVLHHRKTVCLLEKDIVCSQMLQRIFAPNYTFGHMKYYHARFKIQSVIQLTVKWWCLFQTPDVLKYHIVNQYLTEETIRNGEEFPSLLGNGRDYLVKITNPRKGMVCVKLFWNFQAVLITVVVATHMLSSSNLFSMSKSAQDWGYWWRCF